MTSHSSQMIHCWIILGDFFFMLGQSPKLSLPKRIQRVKTEIKGRKFSAITVRFESVIKTEIQTFVSVA